MKKSIFIVFMAVCVLNTMCVEEAKDKVPVVVEKVDVEKAAELPAPEKLPVVEKLPEVETKVDTVKEKEASVDKKPIEWVSKEEKTPVQVVPLVKKEPVKAASVDKVVKDTKNTLTSMISSSWTVSPNMILIVFSVIAIILI